MSKPLLEVRNLKKHFKTPKGMLHAVDDISFTLEEGKTLGIVGESGCGKSTTGRAILRLIKPNDGEILFEGVNIRDLSAKELRAKRKEMQIIFQDPYASLDPRYTVAKTIEEPLIIHGQLKNKEERRQKVLELMDVVGLSHRLYNSYPHELDGGRRQRIGIAAALAMNPRFIVCDEPVSALDVSIQAQILNLMKKLQRERGLTYLFITHNLSVVRHFSDEIAVMYLGKIVEKAPAEELFANPLHPYTQALLSAIPSTDIDKKVERILLKGELSSPIDPPPVCRFSKRCNQCMDCCAQGEPELKEVSPGHFVACKLY